MSEKNRAEGESEIAQLRRELAEMGKRLEAATSRHNFQGDQQVVNINLPDRKAELDKKQDEAIALFDGSQARAEAQLFDGPRKFRVCAIDAQNMKRFPSDPSQPGPKMSEPWNWTFNPWNPWRVVGATDRDAAKAKYIAFFGILGFMEGEERNKYIIYECDDVGQPLQQLAAA